jgi:hypothetical protein
MSVEPMTPEIERALQLAYPGEEARFFSPMAIGSDPTTADEGAAAIMDGIKTTHLRGFGIGRMAGFPSLGRYACCWTGKVVGRFE